MEAVLVNLVGGLIDPEELDTRFKVAAGTVMAEWMGTKRTTWLRAHEAAAEKGRAWWRGLVDPEDSDKTFGELWKTATSSYLRNFLEEGGEPVEASTEVLETMTEGTIQEIARELAFREPDAAAEMEELRNAFEEAYVYAGLEEDFATRLMDSVGLAEEGGQVIVPSNADPPISAPGFWKNLRSDRFSEVGGVVVADSDPKCLEAAAPAEFKCCLIASEAGENEFDYTVGTFEELVKITG